MGKGGERGLNPGCPSILKTPFSTVACTHCFVFSTLIIFMFAMPAGSNATVLNNSALMSSRPWHGAFCYIFFSTELLEEEE